jgi:methionyl-tRNA formyltransferase
MGTPDFAAASLDALVKAGNDIAAVVTAADKPAGRGQKLNESAVKKYAVAHDIPVLQPEKLKNPEFLEELKSFKADLQVVVAFRMLPEVVWNMPPKGTVNLHGSILPQYRGAAPINWAILNGEKESGVSTFFLKHEIDTGDILFTEKVVISDDTTAGELHDNLMMIGANLLVKTVEAIKKGEYKEQPQDSFDKAILKHAPKIFKEDCKINWDQSLNKVYNHIRGLSPYPTAFTIFQNKTLKIFKAEKEEKNHTEPLGSIVSDSKTFLKYAVEGGYINLKEIQLEGKKRMKIDEFLRGNKVN